MVADVPGLTIRGFRLELGTRQHAIVVTGSCPGLTLERLENRQPTELLFGPVVLRAGASGTREAPIVLRQLDLRCNTVGIACIGRPGQPVGWVRIEECRLAAPDFYHGVLLTLEGAAHDVVVQRNLFTSAMMGVSLAVDMPHLAQRITVGNNTFFQVMRWFGLNASPPEQDEIFIEKNLVLASKEIFLEGQELSPAVCAWFRNNWWEQSAEFNAAQAARVAEVKPDVPVRSRNPQSPDFLVPDVEFPAEPIGALLPGERPR
jgi:hypothetical protein